MIVTSGGTSLPAIPSALSYASWPPVQAPRRLATLGLDGAQPRYQDSFSNRREWQALLADCFATSSSYRRRKKSVDNRTGLISKRGNRSEAFRDLIRDELVQKTCFHTCEWK